MLPLLFLVATAPAQAAGFYVPDAGVRAMGRGAAFVVGADDLSAQYYNPAALSNLDAPTLTAQLWLSQQRTRFDRRDTDQVLEEVGNEALPLTVPALGASHDFGIEQLDVALGVFTPSAPQLLYPEEGAQRYTLKSSLVAMAMAGPSAAWRFADRFSVGAGVAWAVLFADQTLDITTESVAGGSDEAGFDVSSRVRVVDLTGFTWSAGLLYEHPGGIFAVGAAYQPAIAFDAKGTLTSDFDGNIYYTGENSLGRQIVADQVSSDDEVHLALTMPRIVKVGALLRPSERVEIEVDGVMQDWRTIPEIRISEVDMVIPTTQEDDFFISEDIVLPAEYGISWGGRVGGEVELEAPLAVRAGALFESSAVPDNTVSVLLIDGHKIGWSLGGTWHATERLDVDLGFSQAWMLPRTIDASEVIQVSIDPFTGEVLPGLFVGNGTYKSLFTQGGVAVSWAFGREREG